MLAVVMAFRFFHPLATLFNSKICGGYRPRADSIVKINEEELILAIKEGFQCQVLSKSVSSGTDNF